MLPDFVSVGEAESVRLTCAELDVEPERRELFEVDGLLALEGDGWLPLGLGLPSELLEGAPLAESEGEGDTDTDQDRVGVADSDIHEGDAEALSCGELDAMDMETDGEVLAE